MKKRVSAILLALVLCLTLLPAAAYADGGTAVYVSSSGDDGTGDGSADKPYATLAKAVDAAENGATVYVMSNLTMKECARFYSKSLTITSGEGGPYTVTRGHGFAAQDDPARKRYNPAMVEVQTTGGESAGLTLTNIIFDDDGKKEGTVFAQAVSDDGTGTVDTSHNTDYVQDAIIASNATVPTTITLGDGAVLRNFGGMSAVRATGAAKLVMESGSVIEDTLSVYTRNKGTDTRSVGPAGAVWLQSSDFEMENGAEIKNVNGRAVYVDGGSVSVGGTISGITGNPAMWQGKDGTAIHLRSKASGTLLSGGIIKEISGTKSSSAVYVHTSILNCNEESKICNCDSVGILSVYCDSNWNKGRNIVNFDGELSGTLNNKNPFQIACTNLTIGKNAKIHGNSAYYGALYLQKNVTADIYGKIYENTASGRGGGIGTAGHGFVEINLYDGAEIKDNIANNTGGGLSLKNTKFVMHGGEISSNCSNNNVGGGVFLYEDAVAELRGGTISSNTDKNGSNDITITYKRNSTSTNNYLAISNDATIGNKAIYFEKDAKTVTPATDSLDIKLGNASTDSVTALSDKADANGWNAPLATFWAQRDGAAELTVGGLTFNNALPVYALVQETGADGKPASGAVVRVYSTEITTDGIRLTLPNGYANGCAVALAQPTTDFGRVVISGPTEIAKTSDAVTYEVPYTATYTMSGNLLNMLKTASAGIPAMSFVVELDSHLTAKRNADGKFLYDFDGAGILEVDENSITVNGNKITVPCKPVADWANAVKDKTSVVMTLKGTGVLAATHFAAGKYLNTTGHIEGAIGSLPVMIPSNVCRTKMTAQTFTVTYRGNGADSGRIADITAYTPGEIATVKANGYTRDDCTFTGWNTEPDGSGAPYKTGDRITMTGNVILYAQWTRNSSGDDSDTGYTLRLTKLDAGNGTPLSGAKFELWRVGARSDTRLGVYETNRYGWTQAEVSQSGDYYWVETVPPEGYRLGGGKHPTNTGKNSRITVYNTEAAVPALFTDDHYAYIVGVPGGTVRPNDSMTRAGVATIFFRLLKDSVRDANLLTGCTYTDVPDGHWANTAISTMTGLDIVRGYDAAAFGPGDPITRAQFAAICARFDTGKSNGSRTFSDIKGHWAKAYIERAAELGWISGFQDGTFRPDAYITRAQAVTMINRMLNRVPEDPSDLLPGMNVWPDCRPGDWFYLAIQEATNSHDYRHKAGSYETWTGLNADPDWTRYEN